MVSLWLKRLRILLIYYGFRALKICDNKCKRNSFFWPKLTRKHTKYTYGGMDESDQKNVCIRRQISSFFTIEINKCRAERGGENSVVFVIYALVCT
jgi:hypothetical protein